MVTKSLKTAAGSVLILLGVAMLVLPGPGLLVILGGLSILATEYEWPRQRLLWVRRRLSARKHRQH